MAKRNDRGEPVKIYIQNFSALGTETTHSVDRIMGADDDCPDLEYIHIDEYKKLVEVLERAIQIIEPYISEDFHGWNPTRVCFEARIALCKAKENIDV